MISKDQFLELKHLKSLGVPTTTIAKKIGISVPNANNCKSPSPDGLLFHFGITNNLY